MIAQLGSIRDHAQWITGDGQVERENLSFVAEFGAYLEEVQDE